MTDTPPERQRPTRSKDVGTALRAWPFAAIALASVAGAALAWQGGWQALIGITLLAATVLFVGPSRTSRHGRPDPSGREAPSAAPPTEPSYTSSAAAQPSRAESRRPTQTKLNPMIGEVIPVWARQLDITRSSADTGLALVLQTFSDMSTSLDQLMSNLHGLGATSQPGAVDGAVQTTSPALSALARPAIRACELRDKAMGELQHCADSIMEMGHLTHQINEIGRHTRLLAFNASIEASRNAKSDTGTAAVAAEMRSLAGRMGECGTALQRLVTAQRTRLETALTNGATDQTTPEELRMEVDLRAREALQLLLASVGASLSSSTAVREASTAVRDNLEAAFVHFQFGDRVSQMLSIIGSDMNNFVEWTAQHPDATRDDATAWLARLAASYTMDEQRSEHHGNAHVDRGSEVEFF